MSKNLIGLTFADFQRAALAEDWSDNERIGFPDAYRQGTEGAILADLVRKMPVLDERGRHTIIDVGAGCGPLARLLIDHCAERGQRLILVDSAEMLGRLSDYRPETWIAASHRFPRDAEFLTRFAGSAQAVIVYSVIQHEFLSGDLWSFFDAACSLLDIEGRLMLGDIPNISMRRRLFESPTGVAFHRSFTGRDDTPDIPGPGGHPGQIDDSVVMALLQRARGQGLHAFVMPQPAGLPFANRREDIVVQRP